ncbi:unnamed protein product [Polarella glacialis]|uniref:RING-type domain-containing protein n=1 Tax=Polarella glacialis TaxID=89957 RepID=A0A813GQ22_POLGL|nr:unnamed protein product [Polarella glacialis]CAE8667793.1 unnamed protein product [Polarella glacialis]
MASDSAVRSILDQLHEEVRGGPDIVVFCPICKFRAIRASDLWTHIVSRQRQIPFRGARAARVSELQNCCKAHAKLKLHVERLGLPPSYSEDEWKVSRTIAESLQLEDERGEERGGARRGHKAAQGVATGCSACKYVSKEAAARVYKRTGDFFHHVVGLKNSCKVHLDLHDSIELHRQQLRAESLADWAKYLAAPSVPITTAATTATTAIITETATAAKTASTASSTRPLATSAAASPAASSAALPAASSASSSAKRTALISKQSAALPVCVPSESGGGECIVCMDLAASHVVVPCGHQCMCATCAARVKICPVCRCKVQQCIRVFACSASNESDGANQTELPAAKRMKASEPSTSGGLVMGDWWSTAEPSTSGDASVVGDWWSTAEGDSWSISLPQQATSSHYDSPVARSPRRDASASIASSTSVPQQATSSHYDSPVARSPPRSPRRDASASVAEVELPQFGSAGWIRMESRSASGVFYYWHGIANRSRAEPPFPWELRESRSRPGAFYYWNSATGQTSVEKPQV